MFCPNCGAGVAVNQKFCTKCGANVGSDTASPSALDPVGSSVGEPSPYAGFWRRALAFLIDYLGLYLAIIVTGVVLSLGGLIGGGGMGIGGRELAVIGITLFPWLYYASMESSRAQATLGKLVVGIKVTDLAGRRVTFGRATGRYFAHILTGLSLGVGYAMVVFTSRRQTLHDMLAATLVVRRRFGQEYIATAGPAPYQVAVTKALEQGQLMSTVTSEQLGLSEQGPSRYVDSIKVASGIVVITYGGVAHTTIVGKTLLLIPAQSSDGQQVQWVCGHHATPTGFTSVRSDLDLTPHTTLLDRNLPLECRAGAP
jgi:uncharacterized RDD family membrane protein YckC